MHPFTVTVLQIIRSIPHGRVSTYGQIARLAGKPRGARQVSRVLSSCSDKHDLPWHRVINSQGTISLPGDGGTIQRALLEKEGIEFNLRGVINLEIFEWP